MPPRVVLATGNQGKVRELSALLGRWGVEVVSQSAFDVPPVEETGETFAENALIKARAAALGSGLPAIADDSGLTVDALGGAPGVRSARFAGDAATDADNNALLLARLAGVPASERGGAFVCVLAMLRAADDPLPILCEGLWRGAVLEAPRGEGGFGYDPLFLVPSLGRSVAELAPAEKNTLSHRARALGALRARLLGR
ncbi:MAG: RdgB/HAM1 family non-canonical purine NTP pyrophosphatase [Ectothiorhodospiraceae bacterium]|nr:RdgB/HAM1 family non-canonical purine NTP pyrophosphatase [Chromatiales bacterium]MCP5153579.1 RdgB/HAM1 family non-canonical purine NTP pyrophosphatase [Ectothiorhodospiraceae bacterium]